MIRSHICTTKNYRVVFKFERFFHLSDRSFGLSFFIGLKHLSQSQGIVNPSNCLDV